VRLQEACRPSVAAAQQPMPSVGVQTSRLSSPSTSRRGAQAKPPAQLPAVEPQSSRQTPGAPSPSTPSASPRFSTHTDSVPHSSLALQGEQTAAGRGTHKKILSGPSPVTGVQLHPLGQL